MSTTTTTPPDVTYGCTTCGRHSSTDDGWFMRGPDVIVQGVTLGTCGPCGRGEPPADECDRKCDGKYEAGTGTYYLAEQRDTGRFDDWGHGWSCWDKACVEAWEPADDADMCECPHCDGYHADVRFVTVVNGERREVDP